MKTYIDCDGKECELTEWHLHEMLDRLGCICHTADQLLEGHAAYSALKEPIDKAIAALAEAYQAAGNLRFEVPDDF